MYLIACWNVIFAGGNIAILSFLEKKGISTLRKNTYLKYTKKDDDKEIERRIKIIVAKNKFI